jgi:Potential Monad-binding region of RPAP3
MHSHLAGFDFERTWRSLAGHPEQQAQYLLLLRPEQLSKLLHASLTASLLASLLPPLLSLLAEDCDADHAVCTFDPFLRCT